MMTVADVARICHETNRAYCAVLGDNSQLPWDHAPEWQRKSAIDGVLYHLDNPKAGPSGSHESWMRVKVADGWAYGPTKDPAAKLHPCLVPYDQLPVPQQRKDALFVGVVDACRDGIDRSAAYPVNG